MNIRKSLLLLPAVGLTALLSIGCSSQAPAPSPTVAATPPAATTPAAPPDTASPAGSPATAASPGGAMPVAADALSQKEMEKLPGYKDWKGKKNPVAVDDASLAKGKEIFEKNCALCHGTGGEGDGVQAASLDPKPRNFTNEGFKFGAEDWQLMRTVVDGVPAPSGMVGFKGRVDDKDLWTVINYIKSLRKS